MVKRFVSKIKVKKRSRVHVHGDRWFPALSSRPRRPQCEAAHAGIAAGQLNGQLDTGVCHPNSRDILLPPLSMG